MKIFIEKEIFENIIVFNEDTPNWYKILCNHAEIFINMTDDALKAEELPGTAIFEYIQATGARPIKALRYQFDNIYDDAKHLLDFPRSVYFLNVKSEIAEQWQAEFGMIVQNSTTIDDNVLNASHFDDFSAGQVCSDSKGTGWKNIINFKLPPLNSIIINDQYLFTHENGKRGTLNILEFIKSVLPDQLKTDFHILLYAKEPDNTGIDWCIAKTGEIKTALNNLRKPYQIVLEIVYGETIHKRFALSNYFVITMDKGFCLFKSSDTSIVHDDNDFVYESVFSRIGESSGKTQFVVAHKKLLDLKNIAEGKAEFISNLKNVKNQRIQGDCNKNKSLNNRLINDV